jgi:cation diffusion facilitator family transporter
MQGPTAAPLRGDHVDPTAPTHRSVERLRAIFWSLLFGALLLAVKFAAYALTGSNAVLSDAFESIVNVTAAGFALYTIWIAAHPADASHPYGHGKAEAFSAGFEGGLILLAGGAILWGAVPALWVPTPLAHLDAGLLLIAGAGGVNLVLGSILVRTGRETGSVALEADGQHLLSDSVTTAGVLIGLGIVRFTGWLWVDPVVAIVVALHLLRVGAGLVQQAVANLMDQADPAILESIASALAGARRPGWIEVHNLRSWRTGNFHHVDFHLTLPRFWDLEQAHQAGDSVSAAVQAALAGSADVIVHLDPCVPDCCSYCDYEPCPVRAADFNELADWSASSVARVAEYRRRPAWGGPAQLSRRPSRT